MRTAMTPQFEIRIAMLGYVSAGKTTVINALLQDQYGQVGMKRTTAGVNYFRLHHRPSASTATPTEKPPADGNLRRKNVAKSKSRPILNSGGDEGPFASDVDFANAALTLKEISVDNGTFRESAAVNVKAFDVLVSEQLCEMRPDTLLVLVDIPGINEAGADGKYRTYVRDHWEDFDCAMVVMDGRHGLNTEEQVNLLEFVRDTNKDRKRIPVIIVCNKVDDPEDPEQEDLVKETREEVDKIFSSKNGKTKKKELDSHLFFVPTSAEFAYIYRSASRMTFDQFRKFDKKLIDKLGRKEVGWKWSKLPENEQFRLAYTAVTDRELFPERIRATNFDTVLRTLSIAVGGPKLQLQLIQKQINVALQSLSPDVDIASRLRGVFDKRAMLGQSTTDLPASFWSTYGKCETSALISFKKSPKDVFKLAKPVKDLMEYYQLVSDQGLSKEQEACLHSFKLFVKKQIGVVLSKESVASGDAWATRSPTDDVNWGTLHPIDWVNVVQSQLLLSYDKVFCESFGPEKMLLETAAVKWMVESRPNPSFGKCPKCPNASLDFNNFCFSCKTFFSSDEKRATKTYIEGCFASLSNICSGCNTKKSSANAYCSGCGYTSATSLSGQRVSYKTANCVGPPLLLCCPEGCKDGLDENRFCQSCKSFYCLKGSQSSMSCFVCRGTLVDGRCSGSCSYKEVAWKELRYRSLNDILMARDFDESDCVMKPRFPQAYASLVHLEAPADLSDSMHFGHVAWLYCQFVSTLNHAQQKEQ